MKKYFYCLVIALVCSMAMFVSCTDGDEDVKIAKPGIYYGETVIETMKKAPSQNTNLNKISANDANLPRGLVPSNNDFDLIYDPDYIYLHVVGSDDCVRIPLYIQECTAHDNCKCFRYRIVVMEDGSAVVTPMLEDGTLTSSSLTIPAGGECYYSSVDNSIMELPNEKISVSDNITYYEREDNFNKEIYRSADNFSVYELTTDTDMLIMNRTVACFNLTGLFYDGDKMKQNPYGGFITMTPQEFANVMGSDHSKWYIKIYIGGDCFTNKYDIGLQKSVGEFEGGYYSNSGGFQPFGQLYYGYGTHYFQSYGYYTGFGNNLFSPVVGDEIVDVYILIKHWEGDGAPTAEWLASDADALYTRVNITGNTYPVNSCFYILGLLMDIRQFKIAWDEAKNDLSKLPARNRENLRYFTIPDAKVVCETY